MNKELFPGKPESKKARGILVASAVLLGAFALVLGKDTSSTPGDYPELPTPPAPLATSELTSTARPIVVFEDRDVPGPVPVATPRAENTQ